MVVADVEAGSDADAAGLAAGDCVCSVGSECISEADQLIQPLIDYLLDEAKVALVPGTPFGAPGFARLSYATSMENIEKGLARVSKAIGQLE